jgi:hypothetical protein
MWHISGTPSRLGDQFLWASLLRGVRRGIISVEGRDGISPPGKHVPFLQTGIVISFSSAKSSGSSPLGKWIASKKTIWNKKSYWLQQKAFICCVFVSLFFLSNNNRWYFNRNWPQITILVRNMNIQLVTLSCLCALIPTIRLLSVAKSFGIVSLNTKDALVLWRLGFCSSVAWVNWLLGHLSSNTNFCWA